MGTNIFNYLVDFGFSLLWVASPHDDIARLTKNFQKKINRSAEAGLISSDLKANLITNTIIKDKVEFLSGCDLIIEAISEDEEKKVSLFNILDKIAKPECILTSNSSSILPSKLVPSEDRAKFFAGLHFFYPLMLKNVVELIITPQTSPETKNGLNDFLQTIKKTPLLLGEESAFILNRIFLDIQSEAWQLVSSGTISLSEIESLIKERITPSGAFEFCDQVGNDIMLASVKNYSANGPYRENYSSFIQQLENLVSEGKLGVKSGEGFFNYNDEQRESGSIKFENSQEFQNMIIERMKDTLNLSIHYWSEKAEIDQALMVKAMMDYFGTG